MDSTTKPKMAYRHCLIGILASLDESEEPDIEEALFSMLDDLKDADPFDVALAAFELVTRLATDLGVWTGKSRSETLCDLAAAVATDPIP
jgi:hypothetical protein